MMVFWIAFLTAFMLSIIFTPAAVKLAPVIGAVDVPKDARRMHTKPMPRFGGVAIFIGAMTSISWICLYGWPLLEEIFEQMGAAILVQPVESMKGVLLGGFLIYILGVIDDLKGMPAKVKFAGQALIACVPYAFGVRIEFVTNHFGASFGDSHSYFAGALCFFITIIWIVGITNTVNLIDGLDGLAAGVSSISSLCLAYTAYIHGSYLPALAMLALAGGALGFLPYNFHPAKIFMGDGGSLFLGFMLATLSIVGPVKSATIMAVIIPVLVLGLPIFDTAFAILRRLVNHRPIMEADKGHLHHRLMAAGMGQRRTVLMLYGISGVMGVAAVLFSRDLFVETAGLIGIAAMYIYVFLTDANNWRLQIKAVNIAHEEKRQKKEEKKQKNINIKENESKE
ncbi:MAG: undecaprenyl/decaprenyl-phosphate alpha-N-acetylglucosaminyl 1-phosphate transferase [Clostridiales bacterium]|nr:undecaprenyl/decaprenyl-phosphate alpha-N-acetylglucosaminyl 1-phosphate transferase [Clostridiales bacterium]